MTTIAPPEVDLDQIPVDDSIGRLKHIFPAPYKVAYCGHRRLGGRSYKAVTGIGRYCQRCWDEYDRRRS